MCQKYFIVVGLATLYRSVVNMLLALAEKYIAIKFPLWQGVTVRFVVGVFLSSALVTFILKCVLIVVLAPFRCEILSVHIKVIRFTTTILFVSCINTT